MAETSEMITPEIRSWIGRKTPVDPAAGDDRCRHPPLCRRNRRS